MREWVEDVLYVLEWSPRWGSAQCSTPQKQGGVILLHLRSPVGTLSALRVQTLRPPSVEATPPTERSSSWHHRGLISTSANFNRKVKLPWKKKKKKDFSPSWRGHRQDEVTDYYIIYFNFSKTWDLQRSLSLKISTECDSTCTKLSLREEAAVRNGIVSFFPPLFRTRPRRVTRREKVTAREAALFGKRAPSAAACEYCVCFWHLVSSDWRARRSMLPLPPKRQKVPALIAAAAAAAARLPVRLSLVALILFHKEVFCPGLQWCRWPFFFFADWIHPVTVFIFALDSAPGFRVLFLLFGAWMIIKQEKKATFDSLSFLHNTCCCCIRNTIPSWPRLCDSEAEQRHAGTVAAAFAWQQLVVETERKQRTVVKKWPSDETQLEVVRGGASDSPGDADWTDIYSLFSFFLWIQKKWIKSVYTEKQFFFFLSFFVPPCLLTISLVRKLYVIWSAEAAADKRQKEPGKSLHRLLDDVQICRAGIILIGPEVTLPPLGFSHPWHQTAVCIRSCTWVKFFFVKHFWCAAIFVLFHFNIQQVPYNNSLVCLP